MRMNIADSAVVGATLLLGMLVLPLAASAQERHRERAGIVMGAFITDRDTQTRLDPDLGPGTNIDLEADLGLESSSTVGRFGGYLWFKPRQRFDVSVFDLSRSAARRIEETIVFGDETFAIDTVVTAQSDLTIVKADYTFAPLDRPRGYLGVTGGLYVASTQLRLSEPTLGTAKSEGLTAPLPVVGIRGEYEITDRVTLGGALQVFRLAVGDASGRLNDVYAGVDYRFGRRFGVGLAYNKVAMNVTAEESGGFKGSLDWGYSGWLLYFKTDLGL
jgi:hypothetical protein